MKKLVLTTALLIFAASATAFSFQQTQKAALIDLSGTITPTASTGLTSSSGITPESVRNLNQQALNQGADAILYEINSGGGAVVASKEIYREINSTEVPTVCRMRDTAASGGYMIALGCDRIVADSATLTGSIGVKSSYIEYTGALDKLGADYVNISAGSRKEIGNPYMNASQQETQVLQEKVEIIQENFLKMVEKERNLTESEMENVSTGEPFLGVEAKNLSLVDKLGGRKTAIETVENLTGGEVETFEIKTRSSFNIFSLLTADLSLGNLLDFSAPFRAKTGY